MKVVIYIWIQAIIKKKIEVLYFKKYLKLVGDLFL